MNIIQEAFEKLSKLSEEDSGVKVIKINVVVEPESLYEGLPDGSGIYDEQTLEDWYDFAATIEGIINNFGEIANISLSNHSNSLSEYIDFYSLDENSNRKNYLIDLRLSDHKATTSAKELRKKRVSKIDTNYVLKSVIVNDRQFKSYGEAINYIREMLAKELVR